MLSITEQKQSWERVLTDIYGLNDFEKILRICLITAINAGKILKVEIHEVDDEDISHIP
jgi:hypothetical protein